MPTETNPFADIRRLAAARDEALRRYTQHLASIQLRNSRWSVLLSHGRLSARTRLLTATSSGLVMPHAH